MNARDVFEVSSTRIREAIKIGTMDARDDRHFSWTPLLLDRVGWETVVAGIDGLSRHVEDEQREAEARMAGSGREPLVATVLLAAFESPTPSQLLSSTGGLWSDPQVGGAATAGGRPLHALRRAKALAGPIRLDIVAQASTRDLSPASFAEEHDGVSQDDAELHFEALRSHGWLRLVAPQDRRGAFGRAEHLYRLIGMPVFDSDTWPALPSSMKAVVSAAVFRSLSRRVGDAMEAGTLDARDDRRYGCTPVLVDRLGWERMIARTDALFHFLSAIQAGARLRLAEPEEEPFIATVALGLFESPGGARPKPRDLSHLLG